MKSASAPPRGRAWEPKGNSLMFHLDRVNGPLELTQRRPHSCAPPALCCGGGGKNFHSLCGETQHGHDALKGGSNWLKGWKYG
jgi:hypothetical protein